MNKSFKYRLKRSERERGRGDSGEGERGREGLKGAWVAEWQPISRRPRKGEAGLRWQLSGKSHRFPGNNEIGRRESAALSHISIFGGPHNNNTTSSPSSYP